MEELTQEVQPAASSVSGFKVHRVLAQSYSLYFCLFLVGVTLDIFFPIKILANPFMVPTGLMLLVLASLLILWAQRTSNHLSTLPKTSKEVFFHGPYCYTRSPTHWGLFFLMLGFGIMINAFFIIVTTLISLVVTKSVFLRKEESLLEKKYGTPYMEYKKAVKL